jgi:hypothetical protein
MSPGEDTLREDFATLATREVVLTSLLPAGTMLPMLSAAVRRCPRLGLEKVEAQTIEFFRMLPLCPVPALGEEVKIGITHSP